MIVDSYRPERLFGFLRGPSGLVFFHARVFKPLLSEKMPEPAYAGEEVDVQYNEEVVRGDHPRAESVQRLIPPVRLIGVVAFFDHEKAWGFVERPEDKTSYFLHRSDVQDGKLPVAGKTVSFVAGETHSKPRACLVKIL